MKKTLIISLTMLLALSISAQQKILFDNTKSEQAGNADWVIDNTEPVPSPAQSGITGSTYETYWYGGISAWGVEMVQRGFYVETLPESGGSITYGNSSNSQDLSNYDVFVVCEPNNQFSSSEKTAILNFVQNGGGLFMISDHEGADRDGDGWDSYAIWRDLITNNSVQNNAFGMIFDEEAYINDYPCYNTINDSGDPLLHGEAGNVNGMEFHGSTSMSINTSHNPTVKAVVYRSGYSTSGTSQIMVAYSQFGQGKVVGLVDSSPADDGSGQSGDNLYDGWNEIDNGILITNATLWLAKDNSGILNQNILNEIDIYPNPIRGKLTLKSGNKILKLKIVDFLGRTIFEQDVNSSKISINLSEFKSGVYLAKIVFSNGSITNRKIIVE